jgi:hypothetical protein
VRRSAWIAVLGLSLAACARASAPATMQMSQPQPGRDPRVGLRAGWMDAAEAAWNIRVVSRTPPSAQFINRAEPGDFRFINSDLAFAGNYVFQGNFSGYQVWDISNPRSPVLRTAFVCPGSQSDVSVYRRLMFVSGEALDGRTDCGTQGVPDTVSLARLRGIRVFDITDVLHPKYLANVQTCRGSHTHTVVSDPDDTANIYIYVSGSAPVRSPSELPGCSGAPIDSNPNTALFRIEVIQIPLAHPEQARIVSSPRIFQDLAAPVSHGEAPEDVAARARAIETARTQGAFIVTVNGRDGVLGQNFVTQRLDSIVKARGGAGSPTGADSAALRAALPAIAANIAEQQRSRPRTGPTQCHDITVYPAIGRAGGACGGYGLLLDITDVANPKRIGAVADSNFSFWHSATFNNDGTKILFTDEWGGGLQPRCRPTDKYEWGANAIFTLVSDAMTFRSYYKLSAPQTANENCVAHNGSLIPIPGRDIMVQGWYQGGISVFDWTDAAHPIEIAYFDRGPMDSTKLVGAGSWSAYWYNGYIVSSEIARGLDIFELVPSGYLSQNEIDAAKLVRFEYLNAQDQQRLVWPPSFVVARAYLDQLARNSGLAAERVGAVRTELARAERLSGAARSAALTQLATQLRGDAAGAPDQTKVRALAGAVADLAGTPR